MGEGDVCVWWGRKKKRKAGGTWVVGKKKGNKKEKRNGEWGVGYTGKKGEWKKKEKKKIEREKTKLVLFVCSLYLVQNVEL